MLRVVERHGIGMARFKPADCACANAGEHSSLLISRLEERIDPQAPPDPHHEQSVAAAHVDHIRRSDLAPYLLFRRPFPDEKQDIGLTSQEATEIFLNVLPVRFGI